MPLEGRGVENDRGVANEQNKRATIGQIGRAHV